MTIDPKRVKEIFLEVAELSQEAARAAYLDKNCGSDAGLRARVEALLRSHDPEGSFLGTPAAVVPEPDDSATRDFAPAPDHADAPTTDGGTNAADDEPLTFLAPPTRPDSLGRIGHYEVLQVLGRGGFGIVFRAFDEMLQRVVALKVMAPQLAATSPARKRFLREARSSAQVRHDNVVQVYEVAEKPLPYLAMEFIPGEALQQRLDRVGPLDVPEVLRIGRQIAEGLAAAHAMDLIHRDIKPGNVLLEGGQHKVKITDFGLARTADDASISQSGIIAGTPMYMAPEQAQGQTLDQRADLFSLGSVLYQMVAGRPPFRAGTTVAVLKRVAEDQPRAIREIIPETPQWLCDIIAKLHAKDPDERYQSAREVADVLADCEAQLKANARLKDYSRIPRSKPRRSGQRKWVAAAAVLLLPVIALAVLEFAGLTHLFRRQVATNDDTEGWVQLFNGKDLSGWQKHPIKPGFWRVDEDGHIVGAGPVDYAFLGTERDDFENFHLRVEARVDTPESDSGVFFRVPVLEGGGSFAEIQINPARPGQQTGSLLVEIPGKSAWYPAATGLTKPKEWFILEIIARGDHVVTKVNGKLALDTEVPTPNRRGHIFLQQAGGQTIVRFRKIEIKELPPAGVRIESEAKDAKQVQQASAKQLGIPVETTNSIGMKLRLIPPGKFAMGSSKEEIDFWLKRHHDSAWFSEAAPGETPQHEVEITHPFYMGQTEITVGQFRQFVQETGYQMQTGASHFGKMDANKSWLKPGFAQTDDHPVVCVSWNDAVEFCNWLSKKEGKTYRLPTEAEWEYSCRAGSSGRWSIGDNEAELLDHARIFSNSQGHSWPVAGLKGNAWGLHDMHGNAFEWCQDVYDATYYKTSPPKDPPGPGTGTERVQRGGSWWFLPAACRSAFRVRNTPGARVDDGGFRVVLVISPLAGVRIENGTKEKPSSPAIAPFTDADVQRIAALPATRLIEEVRKELMRRNPGFDGQMEYKIEGGVVTELRIVADHVTDIAPIRVWSALRALDCSGTWTNFKANGLLADLTPLKGMNLAALTSLKLSNTKVGDAGMAYFKDCKGLTHLGLWNTKVSDAGMVHFKGCKALTHLYLGWTKVSDAGLAHFKNCKDLTDLWLGDAQVGDAGMVHFHDCKALKNLNLAGTKVSDVGLAHFKDCKNLKYLYVDRTQVGDAGLAHFKGMPLRNLNINNTGITDLTPLQGMPLEHIRLTPKNITRGLDIFREMKSLQTIGIEWDHAWPAAEFWQRYDKGEFK